MELPAYVRIRNRIGSAPHCRKCGSEIRVGDRVVSAVKTGTRVRYRIYHKKCFAETQIEAKTRTRKAGETPWGSG